MISVRGVRDLYRENIDKFNHIVQKAKEIANLYCYEEFQPPIIEFSKIYEKSLGEESDVVGKEMYSFLDKGGDSITLRPEFTAGIARAVISEGLKQHLPLRLFSYGPLFRYERPQKGRFRQFHQLNFELIGIKSPLFDAEILLMAVHLLKNLSIYQDTILKINNLGSLEERKKYREALVEYFSNFKNELSNDSLSRLEKNPLRILDSKDENDKKICQNAPILKDYLAEESNQYFADILEILDVQQIKYEIDCKLVRGLDYYENLVFEFVTDKLGAQNTILAGGRYDVLYKIMHGENIEAIGFAAGFERIMEMVKKIDNDKNIVAIITLFNQSNKNLIEQKSIEISNILRNSGVSVILSYHNQIAKQFKYANKVNAKSVIIIGQNEIENNIVKIKDMQSGEEKVVEIDNLTNIFRKRFTEEK